jgi:cbb3-type cytochrome oxidase maturation protein
MYFPVWMILVVLSLGISLAAFLWGLMSGQFADQERARFLPLADPLPRPPVAQPSKWPVEVYVLMGIGLMVLAGLALTFF